MRYENLVTLVSLISLSAACSGGGNPVTGPDPQSDDDGDGVVYVDDRCPEGSPEGTWTTADGCGESQDGDADGFSTDRDLCPGTPSGEAVDGNGCSASQKDLGATPESSESNGGAEPSTESSTGAPGPARSAVEAAESWKPENDGAVQDNGFAEFLLDPKGPVPVLLRTLAKNVTETDDGFELRGAVLIEVPGDRQVVLAEAEIEIGYDSAKGEGLQSFRGTARVPFPDFGYMQGVSVSDLAYASVGWDLGENLTDLDAPLAPERKYFFFTFSAGFEAALGKLTVATPINQSMTLALDPTDPAFFMRASLGGLMGPVDEAGVGFSIGGHLLFAPENDWGLDPELANFRGHLWTGGQVNLNMVKLPLAIGGNTVYDFDPDDDGKSVFVDPAGGFQYGSNSALLVSLDAKVLSFEIPMAEATVVGRVSEDLSFGTFSGVLRGGNGWIPSLVPVTYKTELKAAGLVSSRVEESYFTAEGELTVQANTLVSWTGIELEDLAMVNAQMTIDRSGVLLTGKAATRFAPVIDMSGEVLAEAFFNGTPEDWYLTLDGQLAVKGVDLSSNAHARLDKNGMLVRGDFTTPLSRIAMSGSITRAGVAVEGAAEVSIPIVAGKEVIQLVTDAAICGTETVVDAAVCGYQTVEDGARCGYDYVKSGAECGYTVVKDAAQCGSSYVKSGAECGYHTVTSAAQCGVDVFSDIAHCGASCVSSLFKKCRCEVARSCNVESSCWVANSCSVEASCHVPRTCQVPASCEKVKTCENRVIIPDYDFGTFQGAITLQISDAGLSGTVNGQYCEAGGGCTTLANGYLDLSSGKPEACVSVAGLGDFCAPF